MNSTPSHRLPTVTGFNSQERRFSTLSDAALKSLLTMGSLTELDSKQQQEGAGELDPVIEEQLHAPMKKASLIDNRFKDLEMVHIERSDTEDNYKKKKKAKKVQPSHSLDLKPTVLKIEDLSGFTEDYDHEKRLDTVEEESQMIPIQKSQFIDERFKNLEMIKLHTSEPSEYPVKQQQLKKANLPDNRSDIDEEEEESKMIPIQKSRFRDDRFKDLEMIHLQTSEPSELPLKPQQFKKLNFQKDPSDEITPVKRSRFAGERFKNLEMLRLETSETSGSLKKLASNKEATMTLDSLQDLEVNEESQSLSIAQGTSQMSLIKREDEKPGKKREKVKQGEIKSRAKMLKLESFEDNEEYARLQTLSSQSTPIALLKMLSARNNDRFVEPEPIKHDIKARENQNTERSGNNEGVLTLSMVEENQGEEEEKRPNENDEDFLPFSPEESRLKDLQKVQNPFTLDDILSDGYEIMREKKKSNDSLDEYEEEMKNKYHVTISIDDDKENYQPNLDRNRRK